jgi:uncharacterized phage protein (TIGR01671 family)
MSERIIKFRAWDDNRKTMDYNVSLIPSGVEESLEAGYFDGSGCPKSCNDKIMQYTGLIDKNGTPIFEGDHIRHDGWDLVFEVCWVDQLAGFTAFSNEGDSLASDVWDKTEVTGNVYENQHLLDSQAHKELKWNHKHAEKSIALTPGLALLPSLCPKRSLFVPYSGASLGLALEPATVSRLKLERDALL